MMLISPAAYFPQALPTGERQFCTDCQQTKFLAFSFSKFYCTAGMNKSFSPRCYTCRIRSCSFLQNCHKQTLDVLSDAKRHWIFQKGETILQEGEESGGLYFIQNGVVKVQLNGVTGRPLILRLSGQGEHFGHRRTAGIAINPYSVVAVEETSVCFVTNEDYQRLHDNYAEFQKEIVSSYLKELQQVEARTLLLAHKSVRQKVADVLLKIAAAYHYLPNASGIRVHLDRQEMADLAGTTKEQVSKVLFDFKNEGLIRFRAKHFKFIDTIALQQIAAE